MGCVWVLILNLGIALAPIQTQANDDCDVTLRFLMDPATRYFDELAEWLHNSNEALLNYKVEFKNGTKLYEDLERQQVAIKARDSKFLLRSIFAHENRPGKPLLFETPEDFHDFLEQKHKNGSSQFLPTLQTLKHAIGDLFPVMFWDAKGADPISHFADQCKELLENCYVFFSPHQARKSGASFITTPLSRSFGAISISLEAFQSQQVTMMELHEFDHFKSFLREANGLTSFAQMNVRNSEAVASKTGNAEVLKEMFGENGAKANDIYLDGFSADEIMTYSGDLLRAADTILKKPQALTPLFLENFKARLWALEGFIFAVRKAALEVQTFLKNRTERLPVPYTFKSNPNGQEYLTISFGQLFSKSGEKVELRLTFLESQARSSLASKNKGDIWRASVSFFVEKTQQRISLPIWISIDSHEMKALEKNGARGLDFFQRTLNHSTKFFDQTLKSLDLIETALKKSGPAAGGRFDFFGLGDPQPAFRLQEFLEWRAGLSAALKALIEVNLVGGPLAEPSLLPFGFDPKALDPRILGIKELPN